MPANSSLSTPLSQSQKDVWQLLSKGLSVSKIAEALKTTRQYVNQTRITAEAKLQTTMLDVAAVNDLQVTRLYPKQAILLGYHPALRKKAIITYTTSHGLKLWYWHDNPNEVRDTAFLNQTRQYLIDIAKERCLQIEGIERIHPALLAHKIFSELIPELKT